MYRGCGSGAAKVSKQRSEVVAGTHSDFGTRTTKDKNNRLTKSVSSKTKTKRLAYMGSRWNRWDMMSTIPGANESLASP
jgi:hypothetical protein